MTYENVAEMIESVGLPYAYYEFPDDTSQEPPFICFFYSETNDFLADDLNYQRIERLHIELYTDSKDFELEQALEQALEEWGLVYARSETYIARERMFVQTYEMEVVLENGE